MEASQPRTVARHSGPVVIGYDGSDAARHAIRETGALLPGRAAVVVVVWKQGLGFELMELPAATIGMPPAMLDVRTALEIDRELAQSSERLAQQGADLAMGAGLEAQGLAVADDPDVPIAETIVRVARERDAQAIAVGAHSQGPVSEALLGSTSHDVVRRADRPVVVVRES
jgi:nucleotide-binding universal stress UspA family protein